MQLHHKTELMSELSVEALKILMYIQEDLFNEGPKSKFLMSICLRSKVFKAHIANEELIGFKLLLLLLLLKFYYY